MNRLGLAVVMLLCAAACFAQTPPFEHADLTTAQALNLTTQLRTAEHSAGAFWWGYAIKGREQCGTVYLDNNRPPSGGPVRLLFHVENHAVTRIRAVGGHCTIDAGGEKVVWLTGADAAQSTKLLTSLVQTNVPGALVSLAESEDSGAADALIQLAQSSPLPHVREQALFWLGQKATQKAIGVISNAIANDPDTRVKERAVFALSQLPPSQGVPRLIQVAQSNSNPAVRKRAMFWLGQSHDPRALAFFKTILTH